MRGTHRMEIISPVEYLKEWLLTVQEYTFLSLQAVANLFRKPLYFADILQQADVIGVGSLPIVLLTGFFTGAVLALNSASSLSQFGATALTGELVSISMIRELGPVLTSLMVAGRNASGMASELGSMKVTEQIDAMRALGTDPTKKLVTPRVVATVVMLFFLAIISDLLGLLGAWLFTVTMVGIPSAQYWHTTYQNLSFHDVFMGLLKPFVFGYLIATIGCYYGITTTGGTQGVGRSTTQAMVMSSVLIIAVDFLITRAVLVLFP